MLNQKKQGDVSRASKFLEKEARDTSPCFHKLIFPEAISIQSFSKNLNILLIFKCERRLSQWRSQRTIKIITKTLKYLKIKKTQKHKHLKEKRKSNNHPHDSSSDEFLCYQDTYEA
jgi:hypothetical protein